MLYLLAQTTGAILGVMTANLMFELPAILPSTKIGTVPAQWLGEFVATFGLLSVVWGCSRLHKTLVVPFAVAAYITAAYWFTSSTSFANPAVTIARSLSNTFAGIRPVDVPAFVVVQMFGALSATMLFRWLVPTVNAEETVISHEE